MLSAPSFLTFLWARAFTDQSIQCERVFCYSNDLFSLSDIQIGRAIALDSSFVSDLREQRDTGVRSSVLSLIV